MIKRADEQGRVSAMRNRERELRDASTDAIYECWPGKTLQKLRSARVSAARAARTFNLGNVENSFRLH